MSKKKSKKQRGGFGSWRRKTTWWRSSSQSTVKAERRRRRRVHAGVWCIINYLWLSLGLSHMIILPFLPLPYSLYILGTPLSFVLVTLALLLHFPFSQSSFLSLSPFFILLPLSCFCYTLGLHSIHSSIVMCTIELLSTRVSLYIQYAIGPLSFDTAISSTVSGCYTV